jgi:hypothetical protein
MYRRKLKSKKEQAMIANNNGHTPNPRVLFSNSIEFEGGPDLLLNEDGTLILQEGST